MSTMGLCRTRKVCAFLKGLGHSTGFFKVMFKKGGHILISSQEVPTMHTYDTILYILYAINQIRIMKKQVSIFQKAA